MFNFLGALKFKQSFDAKEFNISLKSGEILEYAPVLDLESEKVNLRRESRSLSFCEGSIIKENVIECGKDIKN